ncbi:MAG: dipeptidase E [Clostridia bacterium]|nr:dipeptidase E [Clostridia bacterium]
MIYFLTSSPFTPGQPTLNPANGMIRRLKQALPGPCRGLFICSDPLRPDLTDRFAEDMRWALAHEGIALSGWSILDGRNAASAGALIASAGLIILAGGHVPTQNAFFHQVGLAAHIAAYDGVLMGISAGSMNSARVVYAQPEMPGEAIDPGYRRFLPGLGVTDAMLLPHYQLVKDDRVDGLRLFEEITFPDSMGRRFYVLPDGSYLLGQDGKETLLGEAYRIENGVMTALTRENEAYPLP